MNLNVNIYQGLLSIISGNFSNGQDELQKALKVGINTPERCLIYFQLFLIARSQKNTMDVRVLITKSRWRNT